MKTLTLSLALMVCIISDMYAQYVPNSSQNYQYATLYNPAFAGMENFLDLKVGYRYQWAGLKDQAPQFGNLVVNFRTRQPVDLRSNALRPSRTDFSKMVPARKLSIHGMGINAYSETIGPVKSTGGGVHYAIHFPVAEGTYIAAGIGGMVQNIRVDEGELYWGPNVDQSDPIYEKVMNGAGAHTELWTRAGLLVYSDKFYVGATYYPYNATIKESDIGFNENYYQGGIQTGLSFPINEALTLKPTVWALWLATGKWTIDYTARFYLQEKTWFGITYRDVQSGVLNAGFNISETFSASYSFEFSTGQFRTFGGSTHELVLALRLRNYKHVNQRTW
jgi:type IX secretion system PorP/SprF family membrane protein